VRALLAAAAADPNTAVRDAARAAYKAVAGADLPPAAAPAPSPSPPPPPLPPLPHTAAGASGAPDSRPAPPPDPRTFPPVKPGTVAVLKTTKGEVEIELLPDAAPYTAANFLGLARAKFYDRIVIHRVVPDFVMQVGCPRGDGMGGPGYYIPDEISPLPFVRGAVGMALAGKDTAGSQFFIMHAYHPHLDGRFTVFARVVKGMDIVDRLQIGDRIDGIDIREPK
jgi:cyclophilin family peptidyl-prolyl cis-trans isomerase